MTDAALEAARSLAEDLDPSSVRILDAARDEFTRTGVRRTTMDQIARGAGLGVATVYRRFPQKERLVRAVILREAAAATLAVARAIEAADDVEAQVAAGFTAFAHAVDDRPLLVRLLRGETEEDGSPLVSGELGDAVIALARDYVAGWLRILQAQGHYRSVDADVVAEIQARLALSLVLVPEGAIPIHDPDAARAFARRYLVPLLGPEHGS